MSDVKKGFKFNWKVDSFLIIGVALVSAAVWFATANFELRDVVASGLAIKLMTALFAIIFVRVTLLIFDTAIDNNFKEWIDNAGPLPTGIYFGCRYIGTCLLFAIIIG